MDLEHLRFEDPTLTAQTVAVVGALRHSHGRVVALRSGWSHHLEFAERTTALASHLEGSSSSTIAEAIHLHPLSPGPPLNTT
jgi:hypothetical protein